MRVRMILEGDVEPDCLAIGDEVYLKGDDATMAIDEYVGGPMRIVVMDVLNGGQSYTNLARLRDLADGGMISEAHPEFVALRAAGFVVRGIPTEAAPWLDKWYGITDAGRAALARLEGDDESST